MTGAAQNEGPKSETWRPPPFQMPQIPEFFIINLHGKVPSVPPHYSDGCDAPVIWYSIEGGMCDVRESSCALLHRRSFPEGLGMHRRRHGLGGLHLVPLS